MNKRKQLDEFKAELWDFAAEACLWLGEIQGHPKQIGKLKEVVSSVLLHLTNGMSIKGDKVYLPMPSGFDFKSAGIRSHRWIVVAYVRELARLGIWEVNHLDGDRPETEGIWLPLDRARDAFRGRQAQGETGRVRTVKPKAGPEIGGKKLSRKRSYRTPTDRLRDKMIPDAPTQLLLALLPDGLKASEAAEMMNVHRATAFNRLENLVLCGMAEKRGTKYFPLPPCASPIRRQEIINEDAAQRRAARRMLIDLRSYFRTKLDCLARAKNPPRVKVETFGRRLRRVDGMLNALELGEGLDWIGGRHAS